MIQLRDNFGATAPMSFGVQNTGIENANNQPVSGHHNFMFNPQFGNNDMQNNQQLMDNIQRLGGLSPTLNRKACLIISYGAKSHRERDEVHGPKQLKCKSPEF